MCRELVKCEGIQFRIESLNKVLVGSLVGRSGNLCWFAEKLLGLLKSCNNFLFLFGVLCRNVC